MMRMVVVNPALQNTQFTLDLYGNVTLRFYKDACNSTCTNYKDMFHRNSNTHLGNCHEPRILEMHSPMSMRLLKGITSFTFNIPKISCYLHICQPSLNFAPRLFDLYMALYKSSAVLINDT